MLVGQALVIVDVADPANPVLLAELRDGVNGFDLLDGAQGLRLNAVKEFECVFKYVDYQALRACTNLATPLIELGCEANSNSARAIFNPTGTNGSVQLSLKTSSASSVPGNADHLCSR
mgnify:CR=1 FL=1